MFTIWIAKKIAYLKGPGTPGPPNNINYYALGDGGLDYHLGELNLFVYHWKYKGNCISQGSGTLGPPNHINYYILGFGGLDYHLGELNLFVYH